MWVRAAIFIFLILIIQLSAYPPQAIARDEQPGVAFTGVYLMGNYQSKNKFPVFTRNQSKLRDAIRIEMKKADGQGILPFNLLFDTDTEEVKQRIDNTLSLAFVVVRDDVVAESFNAADTIINKTIINVGLTAIIYDTRKIDDKERNTVVFSFPLVGYSQRLDGNTKCSDEEIDKLFVESAVTTLRENLVKRLAGVKLSDISGDITGSERGTITVNIGSTNGIEEGQFVAILSSGKKVASAAIIRLNKNSAVVELPKEFTVTPGMKVRAVNMRASSDETMQVIDVKVTSKKALKLFPQETVGPQVAQWFSNFLTDRGGKIVLPSRVGGEWDQRATGTAFSLIDRAGMEHQFELPPPKYPVLLDITGVSSKVTDSNAVNEICLFKAWIKVTIPAKQYEKEFSTFSSKSLIKGIQSFEEKNEFFDLLYQLTAKIAKEAEI